MATAIRQAMAKMKQAVKKSLMCCMMFFGFGLVGEILELDADVISS
jgi:hypothetical protein